MCALSGTHNRKFSSCLHVFWSKLLAGGWGRGRGWGRCVRMCARARTRDRVFFYFEVPKGHPQPGSPKDGPCKGPNEVRLNTECTRRVHSSRIVFFSFFVAHSPLRSAARKNLTSFGRFVFLFSWRTLRFAPRLVTPHLRCGTHAPSVHVYACTPRCMHMCTAPEGCRCTHSVHTEGVHA